MTPRQQEHLAHLALWMPFARASQMLERFLGVQVSEPTVRRGTLDAGALGEARQTAESQQPADDAEAMSPCEKPVRRTDGASVPLLHGPWAAVRTVAMGEVQATVTKRRTELHTQQLSYVSRMTDAVTVGDVAEGEMRRRGVSQAKAVCAVTDGADWIAGLVDLHRSDALRVLDFPPAAASVNRLIEAVRKQESACRTRSWSDACTSSSIGDPASCCAGVTGCQQPSSRRKRSASR